MNTLLLQPTDVLFFRDGRPMGGASAGHGAAWPLPTVTDAALHAALHRSELPGHSHRRGGSGIYSNAEDHRDRCFGSLVTAGPFPVSPHGSWFFPRPLDLTGADLQPTLFPAALAGASSLPTLLRYVVASSAVPTKDSAAKTWISTSAFDRYLRRDVATLAATEALDDGDFFDSESTIGIGIDAERGTQDGERIYSAHYLRLREGWRLGLFAKTDEKVNDDPKVRCDLIKQLFNTPDHIIVGGQQRICTATQVDSPRLPLPRGLGSGFAVHDGKHLVKWILLTPALWPQIEAGESKRGTVREAHAGGWLPTWIRPGDGQVLLRQVDEKERRARRRSNERGEGYQTDRGGAVAISARLVAAIVPKPIVVTGWALPNDADRPEGGAKPTHLAVPAGAVYYFEAHASHELGTTAEQEAAKLADALNWHGADSASTTIKNRRSTLLGEKGFGLGVCGTWRFHGDAPA